MTTVKCDVKECINFADDICSLQEIEITETAGGYVVVCLHSEFE